ncbi:hypothetical protein B0H34DRAFT_852408 [Crassisporium funariophilum]|nr:hypothetical protein B0H34DRAFT_852408 [Crassisporium funariophilum]
MEPSCGYKLGWKACRRPHIGFVEDNDDPSASPAFGFIDPANVICAIHLIPAFHHSFTNDLLGPSTIARPLDEGNVDWNFFYVNIFVDRDVLMRFHGGGVGHTSTQEATSRFLTGPHLKDVHTVVATSDTAMVVDSIVDESDEGKQENNNGLGNESGNGDLASDGLEEGEGGLDDDSGEGEGGLDDALSEGDKEEMDEELDYGYCIQGSDDRD